MANPTLKTYSKLCTEFYDLVEHPNHAEALFFYMGKASKACGKILEPMCGSGRFLIPMIKAGFDAEGFDASQSMLDAFNQNYKVLNRHVLPVWLDFVENFNNNKKYQLIFIPYGSFGLLVNPEVAKKGLINLYNHLLPGGKFIVDIETIASIDWPCNIWRRAVNIRSDGSKIVLNAFTSYDEKTQIFQSICRYESIVNNQIEETEEEIFQQYIYRFDEFEALLQDIGFSQIKKYPAYDEQKNAEKDTLIIIYECMK